MTQTGAGEKADAGIGFAPWFTSGGGVLVDHILMRRLR